MSEATQSYIDLETSTTPTNPGFQSTLAYIREAAQSERRKGDLFERLMLTYFSQDPDYQQQFSEVYLYKDWAALQTGYDANDIGIDLVAKERDWRILCHPVQMLRRKHTDLKTASRFIHLRICQ